MPILWEQRIKTEWKNASWVIPWLSDPNPNSQSKKIFVRERLVAGAKAHCRGKRKPADRPKNRSAQHSTLKICDDTKNWYRIISVPRKMVPWGSVAWIKRTLDNGVGEKFVQVWDYGFDAREQCSYQECIR